MSEEPSLMGAAAAPSHTSIRVDFVSDMRTLNPQLILHGSTPHLNPAPHRMPLLKLMKQATPRSTSTTLPYAAKPLVGLASVKW
eukprot:CAMPEP_0174745068 /NCGR_PEP_ID=MMETSP1094-20130205/85977_1 /TAXON_ID=156173 /ORGANISM="Chrysochromulina brevifilum, Strain UTEX LB 985" /LENGTH=83 /DNA_ID=CAMNT_0015949563 /DNA_START=339 /DNA_END=588 /DNA_ORIENTATION=-